MFLSIVSLAYCISVLCHVIIGNMRTDDEKKARKRAQEKAWRQAHPKKPREYSKRYHAANLEKERTRAKKWQRKTGQAAQWNRTHPKERKASVAKYLSSPKNAEKAKAASRRWQQSTAGKETLRVWHRAHFSIPANRLRLMCNSARTNARRRGHTPFDEALLPLLLTNPPTHCACCGVELDYEMKKRSRNSRGPSLDRIDSRRSYTVQNVAVTCTRCNLAKTDATLVELKMLVAYVEREIKTRGL